MSELQAKSVERLKRLGYVVGSVERRKRFPDQKKQPCRVCHQQPMVDLAHDLWNVFDLIAVRPIPAGVAPTIFVQVTDSTSRAIHRTKILTSFEAKCVLMAGNFVLLQSWRKVENRWQATDEWITLEMFPQSMPKTVQEFYEQNRRSKLPALPAETQLFPKPILDADVPF